MRPRKPHITQTRPVRRVVYFNPAMFVTQRLQERKRQQQQHEAFVCALNARLRSPHCRRDAPAIRCDVMERLSRDHALRLYELHLEECQHAGTGRAYYQVSLTRDEAEWWRRRCYHGFVMLVAHAGVLHTAAALVRLYYVRASSRPHGR